MSITIHIHPNLFGFTHGTETAEVSGRNVGECIRALVHLFPGLERGLLTKGKDAVLPIFDIWVNEESAYPEDFAKPVKEGDRLFITTVIADG